MQQNITKMSTNQFYVKNHNFALFLYFHPIFCSEGTIASKINGTPKGVYLPISKLHSILIVANLLAHNNKSQICYCGQISLQSATVFLTPLGVTFILLAMVQDSIYSRKGYQKTLIWVFFFFFLPTFARIFIINYKADKNFLYIYIYILSSFKWFLRWI